MADKDGIHLIHQWRDAFAACDVERLTGLWASDYPRLSYHPTERIDPMLSWTEIQAYYERVAKHMPDSRWKTSNEYIDRVSGDVIFARTDLEMRYEGTFEGHPAGWHKWAGRAAFVFRKFEDDWKIVHYEDSTYLFELLPLVTKHQLPVLDRLEAHLDRSDPDGARAVLAELRADIRYTDLSSIAGNDSRVEA